MLYRNRHPAEWLETKYRDIADGNYCSGTSKLAIFYGLETKYRDIADGNKRLSSCLNVGSL